MALRAMPGAQKNAATVQDRGGIIDEPKLR
jgi:hypothetical protein